MSKIGTAMLEAISDDMRIEDGFSASAKLIRSLIEDQDYTEDEAFLVGAALHDIESSILHLSLFQGDLKPVLTDIVILVEKLAKVAEKASR